MITMTFDEAFDRAIQLRSEHGPENAEYKAMVELAAGFVRVLPFDQKARLAVETMKRYGVIRPDLYNLIF